MISDNILKFDSKRDNGKIMKIQRQSDDPIKKNRKMKKINFNFRYFCQFSLVRVD